MEVLVLAEGGAATGGRSSSAAPKARAVLALVEIRNAMSSSCPGQVSVKARCTRLSTSRVLEGQGGLCCLRD